MHSLGMSKKLKFAWLAVAGFGCAVMAMLLFADYLIKDPGTSVGMVTRHRNLILWGVLGLAAFVLLKRPRFAHGGATGMKKKPTTTQPSWFRKCGASYNPFASVRDWVVFVGILIVIAGGIPAILAWMHKSRAEMVALAGGSLLGMIPSLLFSMPVTGEVPDSKVSGVVGRVKSWGFALRGRPGNDECYVSTAPRWSRWDSQVVKIRRTGNGTASVTLPRVYARRLERWASGREA